MTGSILHKWELVSTIILCAVVCVFFFSSINISSTSDTGLGTYSLFFFFYQNFVHKWYWTGNLLTLLPYSCTLCNDGDLKVQCKFVPQRWLDCYGWVATGTKHSLIVENYLREPLKLLALCNKFFIIYSFYLFIYFLHGSLGFCPDHHT